MAFLIFGDEFTRTTGLGSAYRETGFISFETTGTTAKLPDTATAYQYAGGTGYYAAAGRAIENAVDPKDFVPVSEYRSATAVPSPAKIRYQIQITMPDTLPGGGEELWAGLVFLAPDQNNQAGTEFLYYIDSGGTHTLRIGNRSANGTFTEHLPGRRAITALSAGETATLYAEVTCANMFVFDIATWWDTANAGQVEDRYLWRGVSYPSVPTFAIPPGSPTGLGPDSMEFFGGFLLYQEGPASSGTSSGALLPGLTIPGQSSPPLLTAFALLDNFRVTDLRPFEGEHLFPKPEASAALSLSSISVPSEGNASGQALAVPPSYSIPLQEVWNTRELRADDGTIETFPVQAKPRRRWAMKWTGLNEANRTLLRNLLIAADGTVKDFTWTHPETNESIKIRCTEPPSFSQEAGRVWSASANVEEIF